MGKIAFVFSGQGAQYSGMGRELCDGFESARSVFDRAESIIPGIKQLCFFGDKQQLDQTINTQPCVYTVNMASAAALAELEITPRAVAGFSLGEVCAITLSGMVSLDEGFSIVKTRAEISARHLHTNGGVMIAVLKLTAKQVDSLCARHKGAYPANYNSPLQTVAAVSADSADDFCASVKSAGGIPVKLAVSGAFHCPYMQGAAEEFLQFLSGITLSMPNIPVYSNITARPYQETVNLIHNIPEICGKKENEATDSVHTYGKDMRQLLAMQLCHPVQWQKTIENMTAAGFDTFIETGTGSTLTSLIKKTVSGARVFKAENPADIYHIKEALKGSCK